MVEATYHKDKLYIPKSIRDALNLNDGEKLELEMFSDSEFVVKKPMGTYEKRYIHRVLYSPLRSKVKAGLSREDIYDD